MLQDTLSEVVLRSSSFTLGGSGQRVEEGCDEPPGGGRSVPLDPVLSIKSSGFLDPYLKFVTSSSRTLNPRS